jgi:hypothetical protein
MEVLILCGFLSLMLSILAVTTQQFYRTRSRLATDDQESQLLRSLTTGLAKDLEGCYSVVQSAPDLVMTRTDLQDAARLPLDYPAPAPTPTPAWNPAVNLVTVRYRHDGLNSLLWREASFSDGRTSQLRVAEMIYGFSVTNTTDRDFLVTVTQASPRGLRTIRQAIHRVDL